MQTVGSPSNMTMIQITQKKTQEWLQNNSVNVLEWSSHRPHQNHIKHLWRDLKLAPPMTFFSGLNLALLAASEPFHWSDPLPPWFLVPRFQVSQVRAKFDISGLQNVDWPKSSINHGSVSFKKIQTTIFNNLATAAFCSLLYKNIIYIH